MISSSDSVGVALVRGALEVLVAVEVEVPWRVGKEERNRPYDRAIHHRAAAHRLV
jgi:hypothetical protein